jgi:hypothetical protein
VHALVLAVLMALLGVPSQAYAYVCAGENTVHTRCCCDGDDGDEELRGGTAEAQRTRCCEMQADESMASPAAAFEQAPPSPESDATFSAVRSETHGSPPAEHTRRNVSARGPPLAGAGSCHLRNCRLLV